MNRDRDIEQMLDRWLADGPNEAPDRVVDIVSRQIERQSQRTGWRLIWRNPRVSVTLRTIAVAVAVLAAVAGFGVFGRLGGSGIGGPGTTASPSAIWSPPPSGPPRSILSVAFRPALRLEAPVTWVVAHDEGPVFILQGPAGPTYATSGGIGVVRDPVIGANVPDCSGGSASRGSSSAAEMVTALSFDPRVSATAPQAVTVGGHAGQALDIEVAQTWAGTCIWSNGQPAALLLTVAGQSGALFGLAGTERVRLIVLDVGDTVVAITIEPCPSLQSMCAGVQTGPTFEAFVAQAMPIVESIQFTP